MAIETPLPPSAAPERCASRLTVLYDGGCGICRETVRRLARWDREDRMEFVPLSAAAHSGRPILERLVAEGHLGDSIHVVNESTGEVTTGGHAALTLLDALPGGWLLRPWTNLPPTGHVADAVYRVASRHRERLAWLMGLRDEVSCPLDADEPHRGNTRRDG